MSEKLRSSHLNSRRRGKGNFTVSKDFATQSPLQTHQAPKVNTRILQRLRIQNLLHKTHKSSDFGSRFEISDTPHLWEQGKKANTHVRVSFYFLSFVETREPPTRIMWHLNEQDQYGICCFLCGVQENYQEFCFGRGANLWKNKKSFSFQRWI